MTKFFMGAGALVLGVAGFYAGHASTKFSSQTLYYITAGGVVCKQVTATNAFTTSTAAGGSTIVTTNGATPTFFTDNGCSTQLASGHHVFLKRI